MPSVEILAVGTELLLGQLVDTNSPFIARQLADAGIDVYGTHAVGDNRARIAAAVSAALARADGVVTSGGLGATVDDLTKEAVSDALGLPCVPHAATLARMEEFFASIGHPMRANNRKQADIPQGSVVLENASGTAPGFVVPLADGKFVACMPGVPHEMRPMLVEQLVPYLRGRYGNLPVILTRVLHVSGLGESEIDYRIDDLFRAGENPKMAVLAHVGSCDVKIMAKASTPQEARAMIAPLEKEVRTRLEGRVFGSDAQTLPERIIAVLGERCWRLATAESCTGGRIAAAVTAIAGASSVFAGSVVAYENGAKTALLGVGAATLEAHGAVSEETALAMARGARRSFNADVAVATTGIAGPSGGSKEKPVGLIWLAVATPAGERAVRVQLPGGREEVQARATQASLSLVWGIMQDREAGPQPS